MGNLTFAAFSVVVYGHMDERTPIGVVFIGASRSRSGYRANLTYRFQQIVHQVRPVRGCRSTRSLPLDSSLPRSGSLLIPLLERVSLALQCCLPSKGFAKPLSSQQFCRTGIRAMMSLSPPSSHISFRQLRFIKQGNLRKISRQDHQTSLYSSPLESAIIQPQVVQDVEWSGSFKESGRIEH